jgi:hypothetical protein
MNALRRAVGLATAMFSTVLLLALGTSAPAGAAEVTPPDRCRVSTFENVVAIDIRDEDLAHARFAVRAISQGDDGYVFLGRFSAEAPRTDRDVATIRIEADLAPGDWSFATRSFDANGNKSSWTGCGTETVGAGGNLFVSCSVDSYDQGRRVLDVLGTTINAFPDDLEFRFAATNDIYGVTVDLTPVAVTGVSDVYQLDVPAAVRPGSWFVTLEAWRDGAPVPGETADCFKFRERPGIEPTPDFSCMISRSFGPDRYVVDLDHTGIPDGNLYAVNLERGDRMGGNFIFLGRKGEDGDQTVKFTFPIDLVDVDDGWTVKARYITPDGTKSARIDCGAPF